MSAAGAVAVARLVDLVFTLAEAGLARGPYVDKARTMAEAGASPDEITDALQALRQQSEKDAQAKIDAAG